MTQDNFKDAPLIRSFSTKSGRPLRIGTGTGTKWKAIKIARKKENPDIVAVPEIVEPILTAIKSGFYHIDTAEVYETHQEVASAIEQSGVKREDLFLTTKYSPGWGTFKATSKGPGDFLNKALNELNTDYIDLFLLHSPFFDDEVSLGQTLESAWQEVIDAKVAGKVRHIGVSNFPVPHLETVFKVAQGNTDFYPEVNQIEFHPYLQNQTRGIQDFARENNILLEAYGPLTPIFRLHQGEQEVKDHPLKDLLPALAKKYNRTEAQILLRYTLQNGLLPITTSSQEDRIKQSLQVYEFALDQADVDEINRLGATFKFRGFFGDVYKNYE